MRKLLLILALVGVSVALESNPALIGNGGGVIVKLDYDFGFRYKQNRLFDLTQVRLNDIQTPDDLKNKQDYINSILKDNNFKVASENGVTAAVSSDTNNGKLNHAFGIGVLYNSYGVVNMAGKISVANNKFQGIDIITNSLKMVEIPLTYALKIDSKIGDFYIGTSAKYIYTEHNRDKKTLKDDAALKNSLSKGLFLKGGVKTNAFGLDLGLGYATPMDYFVLGISGRNLNAPNINTKGTEGYKLKPEYHLSAYSKAIPFLTLRFDADLNANESFWGVDTGVNKLKTQYIGFGGDVAVGLFNLNFGAAKDVQNKDPKEWLLSGGLGFTFLNLQIFSSTKSIKVNDTKAPTEFGVKLSGSVSF